MPIKVINEADIDRELRNLAASAHQPTIRTWLQTVVKAQLLNLTGQAKKEEFRRYTRKWKRLPLLDGVPDILPAWVEETLQSKQPVYMFDPIQVYRRPTWKTIRTIAVWFNSAPPGLTFNQAARKAAKWAAVVRFQP